MPSDMQPNMSRDHRGEQSPFASLSRRGLMGLGVAAGVATGMPSAANGRKADHHATAGSRIDSALVQILFADLQVPLVAGSKTQPPDRLERASAVLAEVGAILSLPMLFSVVMEGASPPHLLPALKPYARPANTLLRIPVAPFHDRATAAAITGQRRPILVIAGFAAEVVVLQTALDAVAAGHKVYFVTDTIGSQFERTENAAFREMEMAGAKPTSVLSFATRLVPDFVGTPGKQVFAALKPVLGQ